MMHDFMTFLSGNGLWVMIIAVVAITSWVKFRERELRSHEELRTKEMQHLQKMKELEIELEKTKAHSSTGQAS
jgi:beta-lactamase regulating signal transducer with metallopeptidase domain